MGYGRSSSGISTVVFVVSKDLVNTALVADEIVVCRLMRSSSYSLLLKLCLGAKKWLCIVILRVFIHAYATNGCVIPSENVRHEPPPHFLAQPALKAC